MKRKINKLSLNETVQEIIRLCREGQSTSKHVQALRHHANVLRARLPEITICEIPGR